MSKYEHNSDHFGYLNLEDFAHVQTALAKLGYDPGSLDGKDGPDTKRAVRAFQAAATIAVDGIVGPDTKQALVAALRRGAGQDRAAVASADER
jgi:peptidoglycan hydrolase-like protein with peptidoglycan-binding domain